MAITYIFKRVEKKYMLTEEQYNYMREQLASYMKVDDYGESVINNIYFDNDEDELIETSIEKPLYKEKLRLRAYGNATADTPAFFEIKKKYKGIVYKRRISMKLSDAYTYLETGKLPEGVNKGNIPKEIDYMIKRYRLAPKAYIGYKRIAMYGIENKDLRITFDKDITSRYEDVRLERGLEGDLVLPEKTYLMEIKIPGAMPMWLARALSEGNIFSRSFSKIGSAHIQRKVAMREAV